MIRRPDFAPMCLGMLMLATLVGCSGERDRFEVHGVLTFRGEPLPEVELLMSPADGRRGSSTSTDKNGRFKMQYTGTKTGVPRGENVVHLRYWPPYEQNGADYADGRVKLKGLIGEAIKKYGDEKKSPERLMVDHDITDLRLHLQ